MLGLRAQRVFNQVLTGGICRLWSMHMFRAIVACSTLVIRHIVKVVKP